MKLTPVGKQFQKWLGCQYDDCAKQSASAWQDGLKLKKKLRSIRYIVIDIL